MNMTQIKNSGNFGLIDDSLNHQQQPKHTPLFMAIVEHWDDERALGNGIIITLAKGFYFSDDCGVRGFDTPKQARAEIKRVAEENHSFVAQACNCYVNLLDALGNIKGEFERLRAAANTPRKEYALLAAKACNSHYALMEAATLALEALESLSPLGDVKNIRAKEALKLALAQAQILGNTQDKSTIINRGQGGK